MQEIIFHLHELPCLNGLFWSTDADSCIHSHPHSLGVSSDKLRTFIKAWSVPWESVGGMWDLPTQMEVGKWNDWEKNVQVLVALLCASAQDGLHLSSGNTQQQEFLLAFRAPLVKHCYAVNCCSSCQESWQRKNSSIKYCNAELADYTKAAKFSGALSSCIYFLPVCYHSYAIQNFLWTILLNTTRQHIFFILTDSAWSAHYISLPLSNSRRGQGEIRQTTFF